MNLWRTLCTRIRNLVRRHHRDADISAELRAHIDALTERNVAHGMSPEEARFAALREFGGVEQIKERCRDERRWTGLEQFLSDVRYGLRQWRRNPGFAILAVCILALGIGACTAVYSTIDAVLLHPSRSYEDRIMVLRQARLPDVPDLLVSVPNYLQWRDQLKSYDRLTAYTINSVTLTGAGDPQRVTALDITPEYFEVYGLKPVLGRSVLPGECEAGARVVVVSYATWQRDFGGSPDVIGKALELDGDAYTVVGVAARMVEFTRPVSVYRPLVFTPKLRASRSYVTLTVLGRLRAGVFPPQADAELRTIAARNAAAMHDGSGLTAFAMSIVAYNTRDIRSVLLALLGAVACVLLVACANVANLLLARGTARQREIAVRIALGAGRGRIIRQLLIENLLLSVAAAVAGVLLAIWGLDALRSLAPPSLPELEGAQVNGSILLVALSLSLMTGLIFGLAPAWLSSQVNISQPLKQSAAASTANRNRARFRSMLVAFEIAAALVLLTGATLLTRSFNALARLGPGLEVDRVASVFLSLPPNAYADAGKRVVFTNTLLRVLQCQPEIASVAVSNTIPLRGGPVIGFAPEGTAVKEPTDMPVGWLYAVSSQYFSVVRLPLIYGRAFTDRDTASSPQVLIINQTLARQYFPARDPVGRHISIAGTTYEVIGVVADVAQNGLDRLSSPQIYGAYGQWPILSTSFNVMMRMHGPTLPTHNSVRSVVAAIDPTLAVATVMPLQKSLDLLLARQRFATTLLSLFAFIGAVIAGVGVYAVMAYTASQRTTEIGIRMTFGATARDIFGLIIGQGVRVLAIGLIAGIAGMFAFGRIIGSLLYEIGPHDPLTVAATVGVTIAIVLVACLVPALRATRVDPMTALRME